jgi:phage shock protein C
MSGEYKKLYRSRNNRVIAGVCAGLGDYLNIDPTIVRLLFAVGALLGGSAILLYIVLMIVIPEEPLGGPVEVKTPEIPKEE